MNLRRIFCLLSLMVLCANVCPVFAKAPTTPKILFTAAPVDNYDIYIMNPDGSEQTNLTQHPAEDLLAVWSPTGEQILFVSDRGGERDLYLMNADGSNVRRVFKNELKGSTSRDHPTWSPDGRQFAYMHINWDKDIYAIYIATSGEQAEDFIADGLFPAWSPGGGEIACSVWGRVVFINVRTGAQERLLPKKAAAHQIEASWSTLGDKLVFSWNKHQLPPDREPGAPFPPGWEDKQTIYIVNRDGTDLQQLVDEDGPKAWSPELSPNGEELLYTQFINDRNQIFKVDINSGVRTQLIDNLWSFGGDWFDPAYALPVSPQPHLLTTTWGEVKTEEKP